LLTSRKGPPLGAPGQIALAKIKTSRAIKSVPDPGEIYGVLIHVRRIFLRSRIPDKGLTSPRHPVEIRARSHQHHDRHRRGRNRRYAVPRSSGDLGHTDPPQTSKRIRHEPISLDLFSFGRITRLGKPMVAESPLVLILEISKTMTMDRAIARGLPFYISTGDEIKGPRYKERRALI
jgi:hypothetical protein